MTVIINGTDNSAAAPAVQGGTAGTTTGIYYPTTNQVAISTNGTQAMLVNASQNVTFAGTLATAAKGITAASLPAGSVLQVVSATLNTYGSTASTTYVAITGLSVAITPATTSNKVLIRGYIWVAGSSQNGLFGAVFKGGSILTAVAGSAAQPSAIVNGTGGTVTASGGFIPAAPYVQYQATPIYFEYLDSPASTSSLTYQIYVRVGQGGTMYYNWQASGGSNADFGYFASTITAMEIVA